jgi:hypothetical protein
VSRDQGSRPIRGFAALAIVGGLEAWRAAWATRSHGWWRRFPFLPLPNFEYLRWRKFTAYGTPSSPMDARDLRSFLQWRSGFRKYVKAER